MKAPSELILTRFNYCCVFSAPSRFLIGPTLRGKRPFAQVCAKTFILRFLGFMDIPWQIPCLGNCFYSSLKWYLSQWCRNRGLGGATGPPIFGRSVKPISTGGGQIIPTYYYCPPTYFFTFRHHCILYCIELLRSFVFYWHKLKSTFSVELKKKTKETFIFTSM